MAARYTAPRPIMVLVTVSPTKENGMKEPYTGRVGMADSLDEARKLIADERKQMGETYGGFMAPVETSNREYRVFRAEWTELEGPF